MGYGRGPPDWLQGLHGRTAPCACSRLPCASAHSAPLPLAACVAEALGAVAFAWFRGPASAAAERCLLPAQKGARCAQRRVPTSQPRRLAVPPLATSVAADAARATAVEAAAAPCAAARSVRARTSAAAGLACAHVRALADGVQQLQGNRLLLLMPPPRLLWRHRGAETQCCSAR